MSSDAFGTPVRKYDFGKDGGIQGQSRVVSPQYNMVPYLCWSRTDSLACAAGVNTYLPFTVPPLPAGSIIRGEIAASIDAGDVVGVGISGDWMLATPVVTTSLIATSTLGAESGVSVFCIGIRGRSAATASHVGMGTAVSGVTVTTGLDFYRTTRLAVYATEATTIVMNHAFVQVFIPRVYR